MRQIEDSWARSNLLSGPQFLGAAYNRHAWGNLTASTIRRLASIISVTCQDLEGHGILSGIALTFSLMRQRCWQGVGWVAVEVFFAGPPTRSMG